MDDTQFNTIFFYKKKKTNKEEKNTALINCNQNSEKYLRAKRVLGSNFGVVKLKTVNKRSNESLIKQRCSLFLHIYTSKTQIFKFFAFVLLHWMRIDSTNLGF